MTITGGEPLMQRNGLNRLLRELRVNRYNVSIETNGSYAIIEHFPNKHISWVVDYKLPSSRQTNQMADVKPWSQLCKYDYIKFVIADRMDYDVALVQVQRFYSEGVKAQMIFSPVLLSHSNPHRDTMNVNLLTDWMKENKLFSIPISLQLHKLSRLIEEK